MTDLIGQQLGNYRLMRLLGSGGYADVYLGEHIHLKRQAAIKVLHTILKDEQKEDFFIEAQRLVDLSHPSIIQVLDFAIEGDFPYLVMEYAPNGTLGTRHPVGSCLPLTTVVSYVKCIAAPLQYIHDQKLVHCDVKPDNLLVGKNQEILLSDLGIAAIAHKTSSLSMQGMAGTPAYMAPEQSQGLQRAASDQYALGIVAYEWLCGSVPFQGSAVALGIQHLTISPPSLCQRMPTIPHAVEEVIFKALAKKPKERFRTITEFAEALEEASKTTQTVAAVAPIQRSQIPPYQSDIPTVLLAEPVQNQYVPSREAMPRRSTQPLAEFPQYAGWAYEHVGQVQDHTPIENNDIPRTIAVRSKSSASPSRKPYASPTRKANAVWKRKGLSYTIGAIPLIVLALGISIAGFVIYGLSHANAPLAHRVSTPPTSQTSPVQTTQPNLLATDTFQRPDQTQWGTASDRHNQWIVDANAQQYFSISNFTGRIAGGQGALEALTGQSIDNVDITIIAIVNHFGNTGQCNDNVNLGIVLRWTNPNNWYKAFIDGNQLCIVKWVNGQATTLNQMTVRTSEGVPQKLRFRSFGTTLLAKVWTSGTTEPQNWMITADDHSFTTGQFGIRVVEQPATVISVTSFSAVKSTAENDA